MSTELVKWDELLASEAQAVAKTERPQLAAISFRAGVMKYLDATVPNNTLECVVVGAIHENNFFSSEFDADNPQNPDCFAFSITGSDMAPHEKAKTPLSATCATCRMNAFGSALKGRGKGCKQIRKLAVVPAKFAVEGGILKAEVAIARIPVTSVKHWGNYVNILNGTFKRPSWSVLTAMKLSPHPKNQIEVTFEHIGMVQDDHLGEALEKSKLASELLMTPYDPNPDQTPEAEEDKKKKAVKQNRYR